MSDPHVVALRYRFVSANEYDRFNEAAPVTVAADGFDLHLEGGVLVAKPYAHFASADDARAAVQPFLEAWAARAALVRAGREIRFDFDTAEVVDRDPVGVTVFPQPARVFAIGLSATVVVDNSEYPVPPDDFRTDPVLESIIRKVRDLDAGRATLTDAANWVTTRIEDAFGGGGSDRRRVAGRNLTLHPDILSKLGRLASQNDPDIGRKAKGPVLPLTPAEKTWMRAALILVAEQVGAHNARATLKPRTMSDLPAL